MCGIAGYFVKHPVASATAMQGLLAAIRRRGPDDEGIALVARRSREIAHFRTDGTVATLASRLPHYADASARLAHDQPIGGAAS